MGKNNGNLVCENNQSINRIHEQKDKNRNNTAILNSIHNDEYKSVVVSYYLLQCHKIHSLNFLLEIYLQIDRYQAI